jgi:hypothetical protein
MLLFLFFTETMGLCRNWNEISPFVRFALLPFPIEFRENFCWHANDWYQDHFFLPAHAEIVMNALRPAGPSLNILAASKIQLLEACYGEYTGPKPSQEIISRLTQPAFEHYVHNSFTFLQFRTNHGVFDGSITLAVNQRILTRESNGNHVFKEAFRVNEDDEFLSEHGWTFIISVSIIQETAWRASSLCEGSVMVDGFTLRSERTEIYPYELSEERMFMPRQKCV